MARRVECGRVTMLVGGRVTLALQMMIWLHLMFSSPHPACSSAPRPGSAFHAREPIRLELKVNVVLVGLNGDGAFGYKVEEASLSSLLAQALPTYRPALVEEERLLNVEYGLRYDVHHQRNIGTFSSMLANELKKSARAQADDSPVREYALSLTDLGLHSFFDSISVADEYSIIIINPSKRALDEMLRGPSSAQDEPDWTYYYLYDGAPTQTWVSEGRYTVVDLSAGPVGYGPSDTGEGAVTAASLPRIAKFAEKLSKLKGQSLYSQYTVSQFAEIEAHLATTIISSIQHVFVPDIQFPTIQADKILIPIIVLRNHVEFNPWDSGHTYSIDIDAIRNEIDKLALPNQEVVIVTDMHGLHEHKHIALALAKAHKTDTVHEPSVLGRFKVKEKPYIDGRALLQQMKDAQDIITSGFIQSVEERAHLSAFFPRAQPATAQDMPFGQSEKATQARPLGTRILPVYVFSLLLPPHLQNVLLDRSSLYKASAEGVIVLQTNSTDVPVPFYALSEPVVYHPNDPTRHIVAGIATALGSISSPLQRYSTLHHRLLQSHLWANGHHPFGPYSNTTGLSRIFIDQVIRNAVISRLDQALKMIYKSIAKIDKFAQRYLYDPFGENVTVAGFSGRASSIDNIGSKQFGPIEDSVHGTDLWQGWESEQIANFLPLPAATGLFERIGGLLRDYKLREAYEVSNSVGLGAITFAQYVQDEIRAAEAELLCCYLRHTPTHSSPVADMLQYLLVFVCAMLFMLALMLVLQRKPRAKQTLRTKHL